MRITDRIRDLLGSGRIAPPWAVSGFAGLNAKLRTIMIDQGALKSAVSRLDASASAMLAVLRSLRDENKGLVSQLGEVKARLEAMPQDTAELEGTIGDVIAKLNATADAVEAQVRENPKIPDMPPAPAAESDTEKKPEGDTQG